ncbi:MAG: signal peptidase II [Deltaproteobacteria bacterium]|nr:MAG: signal peptidase II [Deltaproteobacteria bacterium]
MNDPNDHPPTRPASPTTTEDAAPEARGAPSPGAAGPEPGRSEFRRSIGFVAALGFVWLLLDQWTKYLVVAHLTRLFPDGSSLGERLRLFVESQGLARLATPPAQVIPGLWEHLYVENPAGAFGLLSGLPYGLRRSIFVVFALAAAVGLLWLAGRTTADREPERWRRWALRGALGLVLGGAVGNLLDRFVHGYVVDFIHWHYHSFSWPPFNLADVGIVCGVIGLVLLYNTGPHRHGGEASSEAPAARKSGQSEPKKKEPRKKVRSSKKKR